MSKTKKYLIEFILFMTYALFAMSWKTGDILIAKAKITASDQAVMTNAINIAKIIGSLSAAWFIAKLGNRKMFTFSALLIVLGTLLPFLHGSFPLIFLVRFILGLGGAWVLVTISPTVAKIFTGEELTVVNGLNSVAFNVGIAMILTLVPFIAANTELTIELISLGVLILALAWAYLSKSIDEGTSDTKAAIATEEKKYTFMDGLKEKFNWVFPLSYCGVLGFYMVAFTFMKSETVAYVIFAGVVGALAGTFSAKSIKNKLGLVRIAALIQLLSAIAFFIYYNDPIAKILGIILGFFIFLPMPAYVTLAFIRKNITPRKIAVTFSLFWSMSYFVSIILLQVFALLKDKSGDGAAFIFILAAEASLFIGTTFFMKKDQ